MQNKENYEDITKENTIFGIRSNNVMIDEEIVPATIIIKEEKIDKIIFEKKISKEIYNSEIQGIKIINYEEKYIFPGCIDINVHLHASIPLWADIKRITALAARSGVTTIINQPLRRPENLLNQNELEILTNENKIIQQETKVDFGLIALINQKTIIADLDELENNINIIGYMLYLQKFQEKLIIPESEKEIEEIFHKLIERNKKTILFVHPCFMLGKDINVSSPYRNFSPEKRIQESFNLNHNTFDGVKADFSSNDSEYSNNENEFDMQVNFEESKSKNL